MRASRFRRFPPSRLPRSQWTLANRLTMAGIGVTVVIGVVTVLNLPGGLFPGLLGLSSGDERPEADEPSFCVVTRGQANEACPTDTDLPAVSVVKLTNQDRWALLIRDFNPGTEVTLRLFDPANKELDLGALATRPVDRRGNADTAQNHYFWEYVPGEPRGMYRLEVTGIDRSGRKVRVVPATFDVDPREEPASEGRG